MEFKKVLSKTLATIVLSSALMTNACFKQDIQKDPTKLSSYLLDKKDLQFESKFQKDEFEYVLYYTPNKNPDSKRIRYVEVYKNKKLYGIINGEVYYLDKDNDDSIDLKCEIDKIKCYDISNKDNKKYWADDVASPEEEIPNK